MSGHPERLSPKEEVFVAEYLKDRNATQAVLRAGFRTKHPRQYGHALLTKPYISAAVRRATQERLERLQMDADDVVRELSRVAFSTLADFVTWGRKGVRLIPSGRQPPGVSACLAEVSQTKAGHVRVKLHDKVAALGKLMQHLGLLDPPSADALEAVLARLPKELAEQIRAVLAAELTANPEKGP